VLFDQPSDAPQPNRQRRSVPSHLPTFNRQRPAFPALPVGYSPQQSQSRPTRPPVPLFHSNSTGNIAQLPTLTASHVDIMGGMHTESSSPLLDSANLTPTEANVPLADMAALEGLAFDWSAYDNASSFTSINDPIVVPDVAQSSGMTVSPKDLFNTDYMPPSAPASAALTTLTSPSLIDDVSPFGPDSFEQSPWTADGDFPTGLMFPPLFPENDKVGAAVGGYPIQRTVSDGSFKTATSGSSSNDSPSAPLVLDTSNYRKTSTTRSPLTQTAGIGKSRRRKEPLPPIIADPQDKIALKRARNTLAARESRQRKVDYLSDLQTTIDQQKEQIEKWKRIAFAHGYTGPDELS